MLNGLTLASEWTLEGHGEAAVLHGRAEAPARIRFHDPLLGFHGFRSSWGMEFTPAYDSDRLDLEVTSGRSSNGAIPWLGVETAAGWWVLALGWSGNWQLKAQRDEASPGATVTVRFPDHEGVTPPMIHLARGATRADAVSALTRSLALQAPRTSPVRSEWNHWWPYEDAEITEDVFLANAAIAADLGFDAAVLDAGWFGVPGDTDWYQVRGDWGLVNAQRFPHGLAWLADQTRALGIDFGVWIEGEALGERAETLAAHPEIVAQDANGTSLGYVCLASTHGLDHVRRHVTHLVETTQASWIKWDFNLDPGSGCQRTDHGHEASDGLRRHYEALHRLFDELQARFPQTTWESCSSGGLRIDPEWARHVDAFFLSDPDWTEHHLKVLWGASQILPARQILHWMQSEWRGEHRFQKVDYSGSLLRSSAFDTKVRAAMLHRFGVSVRLTDMRADLRERLREHLTVWRDTIRPMLENGVLIPLTDGPEINEQGHRQPAFQLDDEGRSVVAAFRLPPTGEWAPIVPRIDTSNRYRITPLAPSEAEQSSAREVSGADLGHNGLPTPERSADSALWLVEVIPDGE